MAYPNITDPLNLLLRPPLQLVSTADRGVPGQERVYLKTHSRVNLGEYLLLVGMKLLDQDAVPLRNYVFWLGHHYVDAGHWVIIYTGPGAVQPLSTHTRDTKESALVFHWGQQYTVFHDSRVVPCLVHIDPTGVQVGINGP